MRDGFNKQNRQFIRTIEDLAKEYQIPALPSLYEHKAAMEPLLEMDGLKIEQLGIECERAAIVFSYAEKPDTRNNDELMPGFQLDLLDMDTGDIVLTSEHFISGKVGEDRFDVSGGKMPLNIPLENFIESKLPEVDFSPEDVMKAILDDESPEDPFAQYLIMPNQSGGPTIH